MDADVGPLGKVIERQRASRERIEGLTRLSNHEIGRRAKPWNDDELLSWVTLGNYIRGRFKSADPKKLVALAHVLADDDHPPTALLAEMQEAAGSPVGAGPRWDPPVEILELDRDERRHIADTIRLIAKAKRRRESDGSDG